MGFHFDIIARNKPFPSIQFGSVPVHVVFHVQDLKNVKLNSSGCIFIPQWLTFKTCAFLKLSSSSAVALNSCLAIASIIINNKVEVLSQKYTGQQIIVFITIALTKQKNLHFTCFTNVTLQINTHRITRTLYELLLWNAFIWCFY